MLLLFDIGGTKTRVAFSGDGEGIGQPEVFPTPDKFEDLLSAVGRAVGKIVPSGAKLEAASGGVGGPLNKDKNGLSKSKKWPDWAGRNLKKEMEELLGVPVWLENDAALAGLGESMHGAGKNSRIVAYLTISTGIGGARIVEGKIDGHSWGFEPGLQVVSCPGKGLVLWEDLVSGPAIEKRYGQNPEELKDGKKWEEICRVLALGLNNVAALWSPDVIVLGGGVSNAVPFDQLERALGEMAKALPAIPPVKKSELGDFSGLWGALEYGKKEKSVV